MAAVKEEGPSPPRGENLVGRYYQMVFVSDSDGPMRSTAPSDVSSVDDCHQHHHVLEPTLPLTQPSVVAMAFYPGDDGFGHHSDDACYSYGRWRDAAELCQKCQEVGCEEAERHNFNAFRGYR